MQDSEYVVKKWKVDDLLFFILEHPSLGHYCGYVKFPDCPVEEKGYGGILTYVPVHGGLTFAKEQDDSAMVYGFDCYHLDDDTNPLTRDFDWLFCQCEMMAISIITATHYEDEYLINEDNESRAEVLDRYHEELRDKGIIDDDYDLRDNFGALISVACGKL